jgi:hypothetical protein
MSEKILVTVGCSFSETITYSHGNPGNKTWPLFLHDRLPGYTLSSEAMGSQGNGLISRRAQYRLSQLLKTHRAEDILVVVMWSGRDRFEFYFEDGVKIDTVYEGWIENPTRVAENAPGGWIITNVNWNHKYNKPWYLHYYNETAAQIYTLEHILNLQNFLKLHGIPYAMTTSYVTTFNAALYKNEPNCAWLWDQIDWDKFLPVESEYNWVKQNCEIPGADNFHPRPEQHERFVDEVMIPWLGERKLINI